MMVRYLFLDESGNIVFNPKGTKYFVWTCVTTPDPFSLAQEINNLRHRLLLQGHDIEYFHATEDRQFIRDAVFAILSKPQTFHVDYLIVEKCKTNPVLRPIEKFYPFVCEYLLKYVFQRYSKQPSFTPIIFTDVIPERKKRTAVEKGIKETVSNLLAGVSKFHLYHHSAKSHYFLQVADYCSWALYKKWTDAELRPYECLQDKIASEFDIFKEGTVHYY